MCRVLIVLIGLLCCLWAQDVEALQMRRVYLQAVKHFKRARYDTSKKSFLTLLPLLREQQRSLKKKNKRWHMLALGLCDVYYHLGRIADVQNQPRQACLHYQTIHTTLQKLPKGWRLWSIHPDLPGRLTYAQGLLRGQCARVPSRLTLMALPKHAKLSILLPDGTKKVLQTYTHKTLQHQLSLFIEAPGYIPQKHLLRVSRWQTKRWTFRLKKRSLSKKRKQVVAIIPPKKREKQTKQPIPLTKQWWFWAGVGGGVVLVAGVTTAVVVSQAQHEHILRGPLFNP